MVLSFVCEANQKTCLYMRPSGPARLRVQVQKLPRLLPSPAPSQSSFNSGYSFSYGKRRRRRLCSSGSSGISSCLRHCSTSLVPSSKTNRDRRERAEQEERGVEVKREAGRLGDCERARDDKDIRPETMDNCAR